MSAQRSARLRLIDRRRVARLVGELGELYDRPAVQRRHMVDRLCGLLGAWQGFSVEFEGFTAIDRVRAVSLITGGSPDPQSLAYFGQWAGRNHLREDPLVDVSTGISGPVAAARKRDLVDTRVHQRSGVYRMWYDVAGVGDSLVSFYRRHDPTAASGIALHREAGERGFQERERALLQLVTDELYRASRAGSFCRDAIEVRLPPRQQQVLQGLLEGKADRQIAARLGLSERTVQQYLRLLYDRFDVEDRFGLLSRFIPNHPGEGPV